jgi:hypothetical protein
MLDSTSRFARSLKPNVLVRVMVPSVDRSNRVLTRHRFRQRVEESFLAVASGITSYPGVGVWRNGGTRSLRERVLIVESYMPRRLSGSARIRLAQGLESVARDANQDALLVAVDGRLFLISGERRKRR